MLLIPWQVGELASRQAQLDMQPDLNLFGEFAKWPGLIGELASEAR